MKTNKFFIYGALAALTMTACSAEDEMVTAIQQPTTKGMQIEVTDAGNGSDLKTSYAGLTATFDNGDAIGVYAVDASGNVMAANAKFTKSASSWTTTANVVFNPDWKYYAYFPWVASPYAPDFTQSGINDIFALFLTDASNKFHQANQSTKANYAASDLMIAQGTPSGTDKVIFSMYHKKGLAVLSGQGMSFTSFTGNVPYMPGDGKGYFLMKPSTATTVGGQSITAATGKYVSCVYSMAAVADAATDISMYNTAGTLQTSRSTANCYMIHNAGIYKLPLVYGNAITAGATKTSAYTAPASGTYVMQNFKNHANKNITDPWINNNYKSAGVKITVDNAELLWQDAQELVNAVGIYDNYLVFRVPTAAASKQGNAVIAAKDDGDIVWSWHIWVTTETYASTTTVNTSANTYNVTPVNLGWVPTGGGGKQGYCPYYQWGRKDPFLPSNGTANTEYTDHAAYGITGAATITGINPVDVGQPGYYYAIAHPMDFCYDNADTNNRWYTEQIANLWNMNETAITWTRTNTIKTTKTVYDPCPAGFCVPTLNLYWYYLGEPASDNPSGSLTTGVTATWDNTNKGITVGENILEIFYPAAGFRQSGGSAGALSNVGSWCNCWSASPNGGGDARNLFFNSGRWSCDYGGRARGRVVRPVSE